MLQTFVDNCSEASFKTVFSLHNVIGLFCSSDTIYINTLSFLFSGSLIRKHEAKSEISEHFLFLSNATFSYSQDSTILK